MSESNGRGAPVVDVDFVGVYSPVDQFLIELLRRRGKRVASESSLPDIKWLGIPVAVAVAS
jgi:hypothetical protein